LAGPAPGADGLAGTVGSEGEAAGPAGAGDASGAAMSDFDGIFSFWPILILLVERLFSASMALTLVPKRLAILCNVSPDFTV